MTDEHADSWYRKRFTIYQPITYQIVIAGRPGENWSDWINNQMDILAETDPSGYTTTRLTGSLDQAALIGLLRQLFYLGFPLISAYCLQPRSNDSE